MADEAEQAAEGEEGAGAPKSKFKLIVAGVVVFALIAGGATYYFLFMKAKPDEHAHHEEKSKPPVYVEVPEVLVNLSGLPGERVQYLKVKIALEVKEEKQIEAIKPAMPRVLDIFQTYMRELRSGDLNGSVGMFRLKEELTRRVNAAIQPNQVNAVLFKEIIVQ